MRIPVATYRVQFNSDFRFADATKIVPHLHRLGISHLYASPIFTARAGSTHGYDITDPNRLNPELGSEADFDALVAELHERGMGLILDIVPNHMAVSPENRWWTDVLENGSASMYASYFGIDWSAVRDTPGEKISLPILGSPYGEVLDRGELTVDFEEKGFVVRYYEHTLPVAPLLYSVLLEGAPAELSSKDEFALLMEMIERLPPRSVTEWDALEARDREKENVKQKLRDLFRSCEPLRQHIEASLARMNADRDALHALLERQPYRLAFWKAATEKINFRRFFDITDLIGVRVEDPAVFRDTHRLILDLVNQGKVDGLRVDHVDGLANPEEYLSRLHADRIYCVAEKILVGNERLPDWPVQGTTGYDFLGYVNGLFVDPAGLDRIVEFYGRHASVPQSREEIEYERKLHIIYTLFPGEMEDLGAGVAFLAEQDRYARDVSPRSIVQALREVTACMPVYRTYTSSPEISDDDLRRLEDACERARRLCPSVASNAYDFVCRVLQLRFSGEMEESLRQQWVRFVVRWQQLTGPIMAKAVEDSSYYVYNPLMSLNEVGGTPHAVSTVDLHGFFNERRRDWPHAMNATSTHDTKRSEDTRARINVISELADEWMRLVARWSRWLAVRRGSVDRNEEYLLLQNLAGAWPLSSDEVPEFRDRMKTYAVKAAREARVQSSWLQPSESHENDLLQFVDGLFDDERFQASFQPFVEKLSFYGAINSLSQVLLKIASPGLPDFYRGTIGWDFSLVDPDNRRPSPFPELTDFADPARILLDQWRDGRAKVYLTERALAFRKSHEALFAEGEYVPISASGKRADHVFAFARRQGNEWVLVVVPRLASKLTTVVRPPIGTTAWRDTALMLPADAPRHWRNVMTGTSMKLRDETMPVYRALEHFTVAMLAGKA